MNNILKVFHAYPHSSIHNTGGVVERVLLQVEQIMFMVCLNTTVTRDVARIQVITSFKNKLHRLSIAFWFSVVVHGVLSTRRQVNLSDERNLLFRELLSSAITSDCYVSTRGEGRLLPYDPIK